MLKTGIILTMLFTGLLLFQSQSSEIAGSILPVHNLKQGPSPTENPLKGFMPFKGTSTDFPHSLVWFYIALRDIQTGYENFNWNKLDNNLDEIARNGRQAVFRVYLDYPRRETGIPQFLLDGGLTTFAYTENGNETSVIPDYEDENLRKALVNFIEAFGERYDGDPRIGFITAGLLGFWGEWHCYPLSDKAPSETTMNLVIDAYLSSFTTTKVLYRYPKAKTPQVPVGFHDDSFGYSTLPVSMGGKSWYFVESLIKANPSCENRWQMQPIGGELCPAVQADYFETDPWGINYDHPWDKCLEAAHPTWLMANAIHGYTGTERENAIKAATQMGYDFYVPTASFADTITSTSFTLGITIKNIATAPFYHDHKTWPVIVGLKKDNAVVKTWETLWDLNTIPADSQPKSFDHTVSGLQVPDDSYTLCLKVQHPLQNGKVFKFANEDQQDDGWLHLGKVLIKITSAIKENTSLTTNCTIYKNHAGGSLITIRNIPENAASVSLVNILGQTVYKSAITDRLSMVIPRNTLTGGIYFIKISTTSSKVQTFRIRYL